MVQRANFSSVGCQLCGDVDFLSQSQLFEESNVNVQNNRSKPRKTNLLDAKSLSGDQIPTGLFEKT